ncbi:MAG: hypothetical protein ACKO0W_02905 [Planctomycetota bacterium]
MGLQPRRLAPSALATALLLAASASDAQSLVEWPASAGGNGHWYEVVPLGSPSRLDVAIYTAQLRGGRLAELEETGEYEFVSKALGGESFPGPAFIGAERRPRREPHLLDASHEVFEWIRESASTRLVDLVLIGDSNIAFGGLGWDHGFQHALHASGLPCAAIGPTPLNDDGGTVGWRWTKSIGPGQDWPASLGNHASSTQNAPTPLAAEMNFPLGFPNFGTGYAWLSGGTATLEGGLLLSAAHPFIAGGVAFEARIEHGRLPGGGSFTPSAWRVDGSGIISAPTVWCAAKSYSMGEALLAVPPGFADGRSLRITIDGGQGVQAPFFLGWSTLERTDISHGWCVSVLDWHGGASSERIAEDVESLTGATADRWVRAVRARQLRHGEGVRAIFLLNSGMNDFGLTADEHEAALRRMISHLSARWTKGGGSAAEIRFILMTSHDPSIGDPTPNFLEFRARGREIALERDDVATIDLGAIPMQPSLYENGSSGAPHLSQAGYESIAQRILEALDGSPGEGCGWRWRSGAAVAASVGSDDLPSCTRAICAIGGSMPALRGLPESAELSFALLEYRADCDDDGLVDRGAVELGLAADLNGNKIPDACECVGDIDQNGQVDSADLTVLLSRWGETGGGADLDISGVVDATDLVMLLSRWGRCGAD